MAVTLTRRQFSASAVALPFALRSLAQPTASPRWVLLGTDKGAGIYRCSWDGATGKLGKPELAVKADRPNFFALHPRLQRLYTVNEMSGEAAGISSFHLDPAAGGLEFADRQSSLGDSPCFVSVDATGQSVFAADYTGGSLAGFALAADGALKPATGSLNCRQNPSCGTLGPVHDRQDAPHLHCATISPGNDFVVVCDLGDDSIEVIAIHPGAANPLGAAQRFSARAGSGPRHVAFHPNQRWLYVIHELDCTVERFEWSVSGKLAGLRRSESAIVSTLPAGAKPDGDTACEILVAKNGKFVYACTRGPHADSITVYAAGKNGDLTEQQQLSCGGAVPRHMAFDPSERWLLCANQSGSTVTVFAHDAKTGKLKGPVQTLAADTPMFVQFV